MCRNLAHLVGVIWCQMIDIYEVAMAGWYAYLQIMAYIGVT